MENTCGRLEADYVIVGGGTAGCCFARTLSDNRKVSVIVIEAGPDFGDDPLVLSPNDFQSLNNAYSAIYMWQQQDLPNVNANGRTFQYALGRALGGGSTINGGIFSKSYAKTFQRWEQLAGSLWSPGNVYANYKELENYHGKTPNPGSHGYLGLINVRQPQEFTQASQDIASMDAAISGTQIIADDDYNNPDPSAALGSFRVWEMSQFQDKTRGSSPRYFFGKNIVDSKGYGVCGRKLRLLLETTAVKLIYKRNTNRAIGVEVITNGHCYNVYAKQEVIISLGIHSAEFLQRSGVGPSDVLTKAGVPVKFDNPNVGSNMVVKHQLSIGTIVIPEGQPALPPNDIQAYYVAGAYVPDPAGDPTERGFHVAHGYAQLSNPAASPRNVGLTGVLLKPKSTGTVKIQSADPFRVSLVDDNMLGDSRDLDSLRQFAIKYITGAQQYIADNLPGYSFTPSTAITQPALDNYIRANVSNNFHLWQCSCRMNKDPSLGVADGYGKVYGIRGVRIGDTASAPEATDSVPQAPAYLVAYTLSKDILANLHKKIPRNPCVKKIKKKKSKCGC